MSVIDTNKVDAMGVSAQSGELCMLITDHLDWEDEYTHLRLLQDKINAYLAYLESGQWKNRYPGNYPNICIEINFLYDITPNCEKFLQTVQDQVGQYGVRIKAVIADGALRKELAEDKPEPSPATDKGAEEKTAPKKSKFRFPFFGKK